MKTTDIEIRIPAAIAALELSIAEKIVLAHIANFPGCSNARLAKLIGGTCRGVENLLRRLRQNGLIEQSGKGRARRHRVLFYVEHHIKCGDNKTTASNEKSHIPCGVQPSRGSSVEPQGDVAVLKKEMPLPEDFERTLKTIEEMFRQGGVFPEEFLYHYRRILSRVENELPESAAKENIVRYLTVRRDAFVAVCYAMRTMPEPYHPQALRLIGNASPEKLMQLRKRLEAGQPDSKNPLLLAVLTDDVDLMTEAATEDVSSMPVSDPEDS